VGAGRAGRLKGARIGVERNLGWHGIGLFVAAGLLLLSIAAAAEADTPYAITTFTSRTTDAAGADYAASGGHPFQSQTISAFSSHLDSGGNPVPEEQLKDSSITVAPGFISNPAAAPRCPTSGIQETEARSNCPPGARIGTATLNLKEVPIYNVPPERGYPAQFGVRLASTLMLLSVIPLPRTESYGLTIGIENVPPVVNLASLVIVLCGYGAQGPPGGSQCNAPSDSATGSFLSNPLDCHGPQPTWKLLADSWKNPGSYFAGGFPDPTDPAWLSASALAQPPSGCDDPALASQFDLATIAAEALQPGNGPIEADQPTGFAIDLDFPQSNDPTDPATTTFDASVPQAPEPRDITVELPAGLSISPSSADGLGACSDLASDPAGDQVHYDNTEPVSCPDSAKVGSALATSPLLALRDPDDDTKVIGPEPIPGDVYLLAPHPGDLPPGAGSSDGEFRLLVVLEDADRGINLKLPGIATADKQTGRLSVAFTDSPQVPAKHLTLSLEGGPFAPLATPVTCGTFATTSILVPWSAPGTPDAHPSSAFQVGSGPGGSGCPAGAAGRPFDPTLEAAGSDSARAGAASPFTLRLSRPDGDRELSSFRFTAPPGFAAVLRGVAVCPNAAIVAAQGMSGAQERANSSCPAASRIGRFTASAGSGPRPYHAQGTAYLAGPYEGAPFSFAFITPAVAGPFDLGNIVFRAAADVDPSSAQVTIRTDELPRILDGIPLRLRSIALTLDRPGFTLNPTSCEPMALRASATAEGGPSVPLSKYFQAGGCAALPFRPHISLGLSGAQARNGRPSLRAAITAKPGQANIARAALTLPVTELLDYEHIHAVCPPSRSGAGAGGGVACASASRYGRVRLFTPLLDKPLEGPLYLRANGKPGELPDLVASLGGRIHLDLVAHVSSDHGLLRVAFGSIPDVPMEKVVIGLRGGRRGLLVNTTDLCGAGARTSASFVAHNGKRFVSRPAVDLSCGGAAAPRRGRIAR
jgi:hypothetical protein